jgi:nuclear pore complex protein Nup188
VISGTTCRCDRELVEDEIKNATEILRDGLAYFKPYTVKSLQLVYKTNPPPRMYDLISKLSPFLVSIIKYLFLMNRNTLKVFKIL